MRCAFEGTPDEAENGVIIPAIRKLRTKRLVAVSNDKMAAQGLDKNQISNVKLFSLISHPSHSDWLTDLLTDFLYYSDCTTICHHNRKTKNTFFFFSRVPDIFRKKKNVCEVCEVSQSGFLRTKSQISNIFLRCSQMVGWTINGVKSQCSKSNERKARSFTHCTTFHSKDFRPCRWNSAPETGNPVHS